MRFVPHSVKMADDEHIAFGGALHLGIFGEGGVRDEVVLATDLGVGVQEHGVLVGEATAAAACDHGEGWRRTEHIEPECAPLFASVLEQPMFC